MKQEHDNMIKDLQSKAEKLKVTEDLYSKETQKKDDLKEKIIKQVQSIKSGGPLIFDFKELLTFVNIDWVDGEYTEEFERIFNLIDLNRKLDQDNKE